MCILFISFSKCNNKGLCLPSALIISLFISFSWSDKAFLFRQALLQVSLFLLSTITYHLSIFVCLLRSKKDDSHVS